MAYLRFPATSTWRGVMSAERRARAEGLGAYKFSATSQWLGQVMKVINTAALTPSNFSLAPSEVSQLKADAESMGMAINTTDVMLASKAIAQSKATVSRAQARAMDANSRATPQYQSLGVLVLLLEDAFDHVRTKAGIAATVRAGAAAAVTAKAGSVTSADVALVGSKWAAALDEADTKAEIDGIWKQASTAFGQLNARLKASGQFVAFEQAYDKAFDQAYDARSEAMSRVRALAARPAMVQRDPRLDLMKPQGMTAPAPTSSAGGGALTPREQDGMLKTMIPTGSWEGAFPGGISYERAPAGISTGTAIAVAVAGLGALAILAVALRK